MKKMFCINLSTLMLVTSVSYAQSLEVLPATPSDQQLIELQAQKSALRIKNQNIENPVLSPENFGFATWFKRCNYAVVPQDSVSRGTISLTFDDGPNPVTTPVVLDILKAHGIKATFFVLGSKIAGNEALLRRMVREGHRIGNHSYSHPDFHDTRSSRAKAELNRTDSLIRRFQDPLFFRYPYGNSTCGSNATLEEMGYKAVGWHIDSCDWAYADGKVSSKENQTCRAPSNMKSNYLAYVLTQVNKTQGGILLMHDIHQNTVRNLNSLIVELQRRNYKFVGLDDANIFPRLNR